LEQLDCGRQSPPLRAMRGQDKARCTLAQRFRHRDRSFADRDDERICDSITDFRILFEVA
jgi:hypothetical protein